MEDESALRFDFERLLHIERDLGVALSRVTSLRDALQHCLYAGLDAAGLDSGGVYVVKPDRSLKLHVHYGLSAEFVEAVGQYAPDSPSAKIALAGNPVYLEDQKMGTGLENRRIAEGLRAVLAMPIKADDKVIACMNLASRSASVLPPTVRKVLESIAAWAGMAIARIQSEDALRESQENLRQAQKLESIGRLAGGVAHDFNNLLTVITGHVSLALLRLEPDDPLYGPLTDVEKAAESAANLTRQLLAFSRKQVIEPRVLRPTSVVERATRMLKRLLSEDIELRTSLPEETGRVRIDPGQMEQVLINLAVNARDAMPQGGTLLLETQNVHFERPRIGKHSTLPEGDYVMLSVSDTGSGMSEEVRSHLFEPFFTTKEVGKGTGLGLAMVYGAIQQNEGGIEVCSELGLGTTFRLYLPIAQEDADEGKTRKRPDLPRGRERILFVEDEKLVRDLAATLLADQGYRVHSFSRGDEALAALQDLTVDLKLLVTNVVMPGMDGRMLATEVQARCPKLKVLYTSGYTENVVVQHGVVEEGIEFFAKPYSPEQLCARVRKMLDRSL
ncbi:MAG: ATP-binding protein [Myxococcota bacterium]|nr:ATP-binding protein [Myxococcota bacterium]